MKKLKILIPILVILAVVAGVAYYLLTTNQLAITKRGKVGKGLAKSLEVLTESENKFVESADNSDYFKSFDSDKYESEIKFNVDAKIDNLEDLVGDKTLAKNIESALEEVSKATISTKVAMDKPGKQMVLTTGVDADDIVGNVTGEAVITEDEITFRSKEISDKFLKITKKDADDEEIEEMFDMVGEMFEKNFSDMMFTTEELDHFRKTYRNILNDFITDDLITTADGKITVDGEEKSCTVSTVTLNNDKVKELFKKYLDTYKDDKEGKEILKNRLTNIYGKEITDELFDEMDESISDAKDDIDGIEGAKIEFVTYGTMTDVYANEYKIYADDELELQLKEIFNKENTNYILSVEGEEFANFVVTSTKDKVEINGTISIDTYKANVKIVIEEDDASITVDIDNVANVELNIKTNVRSNTSKKIDQDIDFELKLNIPAANVSGSIKIAMTQIFNVVDSIDVPDTKDAINVYKDEDKLEKYAEEAEKNATKILEKFEKSKLYKLLDDEMGTSSSNNYSYSYDDDDDDYTFDWDSTSTSTSTKSAADSTEKYTVQSDISLAYTSCLTDYYADWAKDMNVKKDDYTTVEKLNKYLNSGKITKYDDKTGKGTYETTKGTKYEFSLKDGIVTME